MSVREKKSVFSSAAPQRPGLTTLLAAMGTSIAALMSLVALGHLSGHVLLIPPMAASMALIAGAPTLPLSQPRHVVGGQLLSVGVGIAVGLISHSLWAAAVAGGLALGVMLVTRTSHCPATATAVIAVTIESGRISFMICVGIAAVVLVVFGCGRSVLGRTRYPVYWW